MLRSVYSALFLACVAYTAQVRASVASALQDLRRRHGKDAATQASGFCTHFPLSPVLSDTCHKHARAHRGGYVYRASEHLIALGRIFRAQRDHVAHPPAAQPRHQHPYRTKYLFKCTGGHRVDFRSCPCVSCTRSPAFL